MFKTNHLNTNINQLNTILIFDSGFGGLSVYKKIKHMIPNANYMYVFDNEKFPYGEQTEKFLINRSYKIINSISKLTKISIAIIACNTVTVTSLITLRNYFNFPIIGIIPDFKTATKITVNKTISLIGTKITINNYYIQNLISILSPYYKIKTLITHQLIHIVEKKIRYELISIKDIKNILLPLLLEKNKPDTIILGCTHFSFLKLEITKLFKKNIKIVDSKINIPRNFIYKLNNYPNKNKQKNIAFFLNKNSNYKFLKIILKKYNFLKLKNLIL